MQERSNIYMGTRTTYRCHVTVNAGTLSPRFDLRNHSPDGFEWGYNGSGPTQLALAILAHEYGDAVALEYYKGFREVVVSKMPEDKWRLESKEIDVIMAKIATIDTSTMENGRWLDELNDH